MGIGCSAVTQSFIQGLTARFIALKSQDPLACAGRLGDILDLSAFPSIRRDPFDCIVITASQFRRLTICAA